MIVNDGLTESVRGNTELSPTYSRFTSCDWPFESTTEFERSAPIRQVPCTWVLAKDDHRISLAPAASSTSLENCHAACWRSISCGWKSHQYDSLPSASTSMRPLFSSFERQSRPIQRRYFFAASTSGSPHIGPFSSHNATVKPIGSCTVTASTM